MSVLVCGSLHLDVLVQAPHLPAQDETVTGRAVTYAFGGKGGNQAVAAARMGAKVAMAGCIGGDDFGERLLSGLDGAGVDRTQVSVVPGPSGMSVAVVEDGGAYGAVIVSAANLAQDGAVAVPRGTSWLLLQSEIPEGANIAAAARARAAGAQVMLNAAPARALPPALLALTDLLIVNRVEAAQALGRHDLPDPLAAARALRGLGPARVIVTLGGDGLVLAEGDGARHLAARKVAVVSTHGAGDAFIGALAARLDAGDDLAAACAFAQAAAALHVATAPEQRHAITAATVAKAF